jgi:hypothetical protein
MDVSVEWGGGCGIYYEFVFTNLTSTTLAANSKTDA